MKCYRVKEGTFYEQKREGRLIGLVALCLGTSKTSYLIKYRREKKTRKKT
jgi:hypothetical protein